MGDLTPDRGPRRFSKERALPLSSEALTLRAAPSARPREIDELLQSYLAEAD